MVNIFISYAKEDVDIAQEFVTDLRVTNNLNIWIDYECLLPGQDWATEITQAISDADFFIILLSDRAVQKVGFIQTELRKALENQQLRPHNTPFIVPVKITDCLISHPEILKIQTVNYFSNRSLSVDMLLKTFGISRPQKPTDEFFIKLEGTLTSLLDKAAKFHELESSVEQENDNHHELREKLIAQAREMECRFHSGDQDAYPRQYFEQVECFDQYVSPQIWDKHEQMKLKKKRLEEIYEIIKSLHAQL